MATLSIQKTLRTFGVSNHNNSESETHHQPSYLSRFAVAAQIWAEQYGEYKYNHTDWSAFRF